MLATHAAIVRAGALTLVAALPAFAQGTRVNPRLENTVQVAIAQVRTSPDGRWLVYRAPEGAASLGLFSAPTDGVGGSRPLAAGSSGFEVGNEHVVFYADDNLHLVPIDGARDPVPLLPFSRAASSGALVLARERADDAIRAAHIQRMRAVRVEPHVAGRRQGEPEGRDAAVGGRGVPRERPAAKAEDHVAPAGRDVPERDRAETDVDADGHAALERHTVEVVVAVDLLVGPVPRLLGARGVHGATAVRRDSTRPSRTSRSSSCS